MEFESSLSIEGNAFSEMRQDIDHMLQKLIKDMIEKASYEGKINITIDVSLTRHRLNDGTSVYSPFFKHRTSSVMQMRKSLDGIKNLDSMELAYNHSKDEYFMRPLTGEAQMNIFDYQAISETKE